MEYSNLIFENDNQENNDQEEEEKYFLQVAKETLMDLLSSYNIDPVSFKNNGEFNFADEKIFYTFYISLVEKNKVSFWCYIKTKLRSITILNLSVDEHFSNEEEFIEKTRKIGEQCVKTSQETIEKIEKIENVFEEFFIETRKRLSKNFIFSLEPLSVRIFENEFGIKKKSRVFYEKQALGDLIVEYDGHRKLLTPNVHLELFFEHKKYNTFEELLTLGRDFVVQTLTKRYGNK